MATKDNSPGLLSKMAKFVRNPTKDWSELDRPDPDSESPRDSGYSKLALKEMIERKRQNDIVRRREFDQLRKLRRSVPLSNPDAGSRPSIFQSSTPSNLEERATTLKKIDEIEAQMSKQWWKGKQGEPVTRVVKAHSDGGPLASVKTTPVKMTTPQTFEPTQMSDMSLDLHSVPGADYESTQMGMGLTFDSSANPNLRIKKSGVSGSSGPEAGISGFSTSKLFSVDLGDTLADPDLEEAAIRFANGDDVGAEKGLLVALQAEHVSAESADRWAAALFDLYRSTGQQDSFDHVAIDYAQRFGRSAPAWFSTPDLLGRKIVTSPVVRTSSASKQAKAAWMCPARLDDKAVQALRMRLQAQNSLWSLNWSLLEEITPEGAQALAAMFAQWCSQTIKVHFEDVDVLDITLKSYTPLGNRETPIFWWHLRLDVLRLLRIQDEFELVALDFCVTYEVSPPPWQEAKCEYVHHVVPLDAAEKPPLLAASVSEGSPATSQLMPLFTSEDGSPTSIVELFGEVFGDSAEALDKLQSSLAGSSRLVISCARLIRVDFSAAGSILNWVAVRQSEGCQVQFRDVPRLVAVFFNVIGINEHATVVLRTS